MLKINCSDFSKIAEIILSNKTFSIYSHIHTDIDAIGSSLALKKCLEKMGKTAHVFIDSVFPENANTLKDYDKINNEKLEKYDVVFVLDCADQTRMGRLQYKYRKNTKISVQIDHHMDNPLFANVNYVKEDESSTAEIIYSLIKYLKVEMDKDIAKCLLSGILTDTGCLKFSNTHPSTLKVSAELLTKCGCKMDDISYPLFNNLSLGSYNLKKQSLNKLEFLCDGKACLVVLTKEDLEACNATFEETKGLCDIPMQIGAVKCVVVASQCPYDDIFYVSVRTKDNYSARNVAVMLGGGGHQKASGGKIDADEDEVRKTLISAIEKEMKQ